MDFLEDGDSADPHIVLLRGCGSLAQEALAPFRNAWLHIVAPDRPAGPYCSSTVPDILADFPYRHAASLQSLRMMADELLQFKADMAAVGDVSIKCAADTSMEWMMPSLIRPGISIG
jgi:hypothetical protein